MDADRIREMLKEWILERGTQTEIAAKLETTDATVSRWLNGERPLSLDNLDRLLKAAGTDILTLVSLHSAESGVSRQSVPVLPLRSVPAMKDEGFDALVKTAAAATKDRIVVPFSDTPALAIRLPSDLAHFDLRSGDVVGVVRAENMEPGKPVAIQVQGRTEIGTYQVRRGKAQVAVEGHVYEEGEYVPVGRVRGFWRDL